MDEFFKWLSGSPIATSVLVVGIGLFLAICIVAFLDGRGIRVFGFRIDPKPSGAMVQVGEVPFPDSDLKAPEFHGRAFKGRVAVHKSVLFDPPFKKSPRVVVSLSLVDFGHLTEHRIDRLKVYAHGVTRHGFDLYFETWEDSVVWNVAAAWVAVSD